MNRAGSTSVYHHSPGRVTSREEREAAGSQVLYGSSKVSNVLGASSWRKGGSSLPITQHGRAAQRHVPDAWRHKKVPVPRHAPSDAARGSLAQGLRRCGVPLALGAS